MKALTKTVTVGDPSTVKKHPFSEGFRSRFLGHCCFWVCGEAELYGEGRRAYVRAKLLTLDQMGSGEQEEEATVPNIPFQRHSQWLNLPPPGPTAWRFPPQCHHRRPLTHGPLGDAMDINDKKKMACLSCPSHSSIHWLIQWCICTHTGPWMFILRFGLQSNDTLFPEQPMSFQFWCFQTGSAYPLNMPLSFCLLALLFLLWQGVM